MAAGIRTRHGRSCRSREGGRCNCTPSYEAWVYSKRDGRKIRKTFHDLAEAKGWRADADSAVRKRTLRAPSRVTLSEAATAWLEGARAGNVRNRSGDAYKPSSIRSYEIALRLRVLPVFGDARLADISRVDLQEFAETDSSARVTTRAPSIRPSCRSGRSTTAPSLGVRWH
jgi:integrase